MAKRSKRRDKSDLGPDFVAPDGGWGWVVCIAAGLNNLTMYPPFQQYGLIYRQRMVSLGFSAKETTTIANIMLSLSSLVGIVNGAMFRRYTFRQVSIVGSILIFTGILLSMTCTKFWQYVLCLSLIYGIGQGLNVSAFSLAVNTYFRDRRRRAIGFTWTITGLGPIIFPHFTSLILIYYGGQGTILIYAAISLHTLMCALTLQPVLWHTAKKAKSKVEDLQETIPLSNTAPQDGVVSEMVQECKYCQYVKNGGSSTHITQFEFDDDEDEDEDSDIVSYEITVPGTPLMLPSNDGWFGSKSSLHKSASTTRLRHKFERQTSIRAPIAEVERADDVVDDNDNHAESTQRPNQPVLRENHALDFHCTCAEERVLQQSNNVEALKSVQQQTGVLLASGEEEDLNRRKMSFKQKIVKFFDLDLLRDLTFVNLVVGMTLMMFAEINFSILTPFILNQYGYTNEQISTAMSMLGGMDICVRFLAPIVLEKVKLSNQVLFAFGIIALTLGRMFVTLTDSYHVTLALFVLIGFGKGFRTIFSSLIIPSYVPLKRLPAASGLQLVCNTLFSLSFGPIIGAITDATNYTITIHFLNLLTTTALLIWLLEYLVRRMLGMKAKTTMEE
ncbi:uncharacterized protein LOC101458298 [Ceratitis capitata]|uniref:uncharacterized protein LOC101458298 n=1 Tax=Ceratitis capitata TaxID=7213 RepID=UPI000329CB12|nr:uncharacterized protein LOC101458298 [Ceratitis capitata]XP_012160971.1 uncharacterized protein LOC101458298 [Ceratitis capitata]XP_020716901.1 uncharacterized protein LOC101458298 [Ceratitis capitata]XP_020716902.1 uncharacterized protein LOC101458298 [Ceratitis capitata]